MLRDGPQFSTFSQVYTEYSFFLPVFVETIPYYRSHRSIHYKHNTYFFLYIGIACQILWNVFLSFALARFLVIATVFAPKSDSVVDLHAIWPARTESERCKDICIHKMLI